MKPVVIIRHSPTEGPGYFATFLERHGLSWRLVAIDRGDPLPAGAADCAGLAFMGGPMSVNDPLPWITEECELIRDAVAQGIPVIGHCLGGQLMCKAMGGIVARNSVKEIGWGNVEVDPGDASRAWLGDLAESFAPTVFQWHGETFSIPQDATRLMHNVWCENQAFVRGPHLAMQFHVEMTSSMIACWGSAWGDEIPDPGTLPASIQTPDQMIAAAPRLLPTLRQLADQLYGIWISGLRAR